MGCFGVDCVAGGGQAMAGAQAKPTAKRAASKHNAKPAAAK